MKKFRTKIWHVNHLPEVIKPLIVTNAREITTKLFSGVATEADNFKRRFSRECAHIEAIFDDQGKFVGYVFYEPFLITADVNTAKGIEQQEFLVLKSGLGCIIPEYEGCGIISTLLTRYLIKLQVETGLPCIFLYRASSPSSYVMFAHGMKSFYPNEDPAIDLSQTGEQFMRIMFEADYRLHKSDTSANNVTSEILEKNLKNHRVLFPAGLKIREDALPMSLSFIKRMAAHNKSDTLSRAIQLFTIYDYSETEIKTAFGYHKGLAIICLFPLTLDTLTVLSTSADKESKPNEKRDRLIAEANKIIDTSKVTQPVTYSSLQAILGKNTLFHQRFKLVNTVTPNLADSDSEGKALEMNTSSNFTK